MAQVIWTHEALDDLDAVCGFIARDTSRYAELFAERVFRATNHLVEFPRVGRVVPEIGRDDIREVIVQSYRVIYRVLPEVVQILAVHHGARRLEDFQAPDGDG